MRMRVSKYLPEKLYGFTEGSSEADQVFFHLGAFDPKGAWMRTPRCSLCPRNGCSWALAAPPPILGELVEVTLCDGPQPEGKAPKALRVERMVAPQAISGTVETFDSQRGYGFLKGDDGKSYHLHRSEVAEGRIPLPGQLVMFYAGIRQGKPRACHVRICPGP
jgi:cold shock CspA family protein